MGIIIIIFVIMVIIITTIRLSLALEFRADRSSVELYHILKPKPQASGHATAQHAMVTEVGQLGTTTRGRGRGEPTPQGTTGGGYHGPGVGGAGGRQLERKVKTRAFFG